MALKVSVTFVVVGSEGSATVTLLTFRLLLAATDCGVIGAAIDSGPATAIVTLLVALLPSGSVAERATVSLPAKPLLGV